VPPATPVRARFEAALRVHQSASSSFRAHSTDHLFTDLFVIARRCEDQVTLSFSADAVSPGKAGSTK